MGKKDPRIDAYIAKAAPFARPVLKHLRKVVHAGCPNVDETMKWSMPHFDYKGVMCGMAAFKAHCVFGFWKGELLFEDKSKFDEAMGHFGCIRNISDLPPEKALIGYVKKAAELNEKGIKVPSRAKPKKKEPLNVPDYFLVALRKNKKAFPTFENFNYSNKREYVQWVTEAKRDETRAQRLKTAVEWMAQGKKRNWKYC